jgi:G3E family GTPase
MDSLLQRTRIPVYLLTGYLGSGKTTLLASWLKDMELSESALIINEVGEVGLDQHILNMATEDVTLMANACVCCTGLPGLVEALADLFWARLQRKIKPFKSVVIETTGLADPQPILRIFKQDSLLSERYWLAGVIAAFSATSGSRTVALHPEAMSQLATADLVIVTKTDLVQQAALAGLAASVSALNPRATLAMSGKASLTAGSMLSMLGLRPAVDQEPLAPVPGSLGGGAPTHSHHNEHASKHHSARTAFLALPGALKRQTLGLQLGLWIGKHQDQLLRLKGMVRMDDGSVVTVQWANGDAGADIAPFGRVGELPGAVQMGLTVIAEEAFDFPAGEALVRLLIDRQSDRFADPAEHFNQSVDGELRGFTGDDV